MANSNSSARQGVAAGVSIGAAVLLFIVSAIGLLEGISAIANDKVFIVGPDYVYSFTTTTWGWIHLVIGVIGILIAVGLARGADWGKGAALVIASVSIVAHFMWMPHYPLWAIIIIALDIVVIWAVMTWQTDAN